MLLEFKNNSRVVLIIVSRPSIEFNEFHAFYQEKMTHVCRLDILFLFRSYALLIM